jgi:hypothetical protein
MRTNGQAAKPRHVAFSHLNELEHLGRQVMAQGCVAEVQAAAAARHYSHSMVLGGLLLMS